MNARIFKIRTKLFIIAPKIEIKSIKLKGSVTNDLGVI